MVNNSLDFGMCTECGAVSSFGVLAMTNRCPKCGQSLPIGTVSYFPANVGASIELMEEFSHSESRNHSLAVIVFFCTLGEALLQNFLTRRMTKEGRSRQEQKMLLDKYLGTSKRVKELFPLVTGRVQWLKALQEINISSSINYLALNEFCVKAIAIRNLLLHQGMRLTSPWNMSEECVRQVKPMLSMFVALHNKYIVPFKYSLS